MHHLQNLTGTKIFNNIFRPHISAGVLNSTTVFRTNNMANATQDNFTDPARGDYTLRATSAAIDAGMVFPPYTDGFTGAAPDLGAFERGVEPWKAGSSIPESEWGQAAAW